MDGWVIWDLDAALIVQENCAGAGEPEVGQGPLRKPEKGTGLGAPPDGRLQSPRREVRAVDELRES